MIKESDFLSLPTAWQVVEPSWATQKKVKLYIKRDDLIHPLISGNKWRKLKGILEHYKESNAITTYGGAYSNHLIATAKYCQLMGLDCIGIIRGEPFQRMSTVLELCKYFGMKLQFVERSTYREVCRTEGQLNGWLHIPEGGASIHGIEGCTEILKEDRPELDEMVVACGTGTTLAGLSKGKYQTDYKGGLIGVSVLKNGEFLYDDVLKLSGISNYDIALDYHFGGYAKSTKALIDFIEEFAIETSVLLDPVYTAKAAFAIKDLVLSNRIRAGSKVGLLHTGGHSGWYGKWTEIGA